VVGVGGGARRGAQKNCPRKQARENGPPLRRLRSSADQTTRKRQVAPFPASDGVWRRRRAVQKSAYSPQKNARGRTA